MRVLLTGSSGQLGRAIAELLAPLHEVVGLDRIPGPCTTHCGSIEDRDLVFRLTRGADAVIHTASLHAPHVPRRTKEEFLDVNVRGTLHLLESSIEHGVRRFVYTSTTSLYGFALVPSNQAIWVTEELVPRPRDIYDLTKIAAEQLCEHFAAAAALPVLCLRTSRFWDEEARLQAVYRLYRSLDVRDAASAHLLALHNLDVTFGVFNISAQSPFREDETQELFQDARSVILRHHPQAEAVFRSRGWTLPQSIDRVYVIEKARCLLGYSPKHGFDEILRHG